MTPVHTQTIDYHPNSCDYIHCFYQLGLKHPVLFDSCYPIGSDEAAHVNSRFDIISAAPVEFLTAKAGDKNASRTLTAFFEKYQAFEFDQSQLAQEQQSLPFVGGIISSFSYEFGKILNNKASLHPPKDEQQTLYHVGFYPWCIIQDHQQQKSYWICLNAFQSASQSQLTLILDQLKQSNAIEEFTQQLSFKLAQPLKADVDLTAYQQQFNRVQAYIRAGDCYQVNFAKHYRGQYKGHPWKAYLQLREAAKAPFSAFWDCATEHYLCVSPERFIRIDQRMMSTKPIKGTRPRGQTPQEDQQLKDALSKSIKDCAENLMIVDLLRNDLGKHCVPGSIRVDKLFVVESFSTVHHLVSEIYGELDSSCTQIDAFLDCFPGGSITGAPKIRSMEIIQELESADRQIYCGSIAYFSAHQNMDSNICIRTFLCRETSNDGGEIFTWAGGGIVYDSDREKEFAECGYKIDRLIRALD